MACGPTVWSCEKGWIYVSPPAGSGGEKPDIAAGGGVLSTFYVLIGKINTLRSYNSLGIHQIYKIRINLKSLYANNLDLFRNIPTCFVMKARIPCLLFWRHMLEAEVLVKMKYYIHNTRQLIEESIGLCLVY